MKTSILEREIFKHLQKAGTYMCFEVMMPTEHKGIPNERVDLLTYNTRGDWGFYELKTNKSDFYSKNKHTFYGNYNYFVLPQKLFEIVADDIPPDIGVYVVERHEYYNRYKCRCAIKPKRREMEIDIASLNHAFIQALSREHEKYRKLITHIAEHGVEVK